MRARPDWQRSRRRNQAAVRLRSRPLRRRPNVAPGAEDPIDRPRDRRPEPTVRLRPLRHRSQQRVRDRRRTQRRGGACGRLQPGVHLRGTGLGKTHLTQAIAHEALKQHRELQVRYVTCERFTDDFINAVTDKGRIEGFKQTYRDNDVLIVDDVQFLAEKQQTQVEFFHTFNALYEAGKQIVITSDRPPRELEELEERLRSRFGQGVVVDIGRPDLETRIAILRKQVKWEGYDIAEPEALEWIAQKVTTNIRELYGALTRVVGFASIHGSEVTLEITREALKDILPKAYQHPVTIEMVQAEVARQFGMHVNDLRGNRRTQDVAYARHIAMYLSRELTEASLPQIGTRSAAATTRPSCTASTRSTGSSRTVTTRQLQDLVALIGARLKTAH